MLIRYPAARECGCCGMRTCANFFRVGHSLRSPRDDWLQQSSFSTFSPKHTCTQHTTRAREPCDVRGNTVTSHAHCDVLGNTAARLGGESKWDTYADTHNTRYCSRYCVHQKCRVVTIKVDSRPEVQYVFLSRSWKISRNENKALDKVRTGGADFFFVATAAVCPYWCEKQHTAKRKLNRFSASGGEERPNLEALLQSSVQHLRTVTTSRRVLDVAFAVIRIVRDCQQTALSLYLPPLFFSFLLVRVQLPVGICSDWFL